MKWTFGIALSVMMALAQAQDYPAKPIRILVPFAPGVAVDTSTRILTQKMTERLGWNFVVENRPGGNGFIATTAVAKAPADGYTLLMAHTGEFAVNPALFADVPYELERDFTPITMVSDAPMLYLAKSAASFNNFQELVRDAKAKPGTKEFRIAMRDAIEGVRDLPANGGVFNFSSTDHSGLDGRAVVMAEIQNGAFKYVGQ